VTADRIVRHKTAMPEPPEPPPDPDAVRELIGFTLADESYALPLGSVREILKPPPLTEVPRADRDVLGIISVRGRIITVIDLRRRLRLPERDTGKLARVLLVDDGREVLGLRVDGVLQVYRLRLDEIEQEPVVAGDVAEYVVGIGRPRSGPRARRAGRSPVAAPDEMLILLDPALLLKR
jgi:purine-binding chemotaxis protein CheW